MAAEALRTLCGQIKIRQEKIPGKRGARWIATFSPDVVALLRKVSQDKGYPDAASLATAPTETQPVEVVIEKIPTYETLAPVFLQMEKNGASVQTIASATRFPGSMPRTSSILPRRGNAPSGSLENELEQVRPNRPSTRTLKRTSRICAT